MGTGVRVRMSQVYRIQRTLKESVQSLFQRAGYRPTYRESHYRRSVIWRLTPLARYVMIILGVVALVLMGVLANRTMAAHGGSELLSVELTTNPLPTVPLTPILVVLQNQNDGNATPLPTQPSTAEPAPTATPDLTRAPWAGQLFREPDGTLMAPQKVIVQAKEDLGGWYIVQRDLPVGEWLSRRNTILNTYFAGAALQEMLSIEQSRDLYAMNRAGRYSIEIRRFAPDGLTAKAGVITRDWVSDVYDVQTKQLVARGQIKRDTLTIWSIAYDQLSGHWKFMHTDEVTELTP